MDRLLYLAMTGAKHTLQAQQTNNHNLANLNTPGFRADLDAMLSAPVHGPGHPSRVYSQETTIGSDFRQGAVMSTGRELDVAVNGEGWIAVQAADGGEAYTRRGDLRISAAGLLENGAGQLVLGNGGPIAIPPAQKLEIGGDGTISIVPLGQGANTLAVVDRIRLVRPEQAQLVKGEDGLFRQKDGAPAEPDAAVQLTSGMLEGSNVNSVDALVKMIDHARSYETYIKLMASAKQNDEVSSRLMRLGG
jgi:flagellar basal-body rod protein FlgF